MDILIGRWPCNDRDMLEERHVKTEGWNNAATSHKATKIITKPPEPGKVPL
jgi:hypothetical protein